MPSRHQLYNDILGKSVTGGVRMHAKGTIGPDIEWERYRYTLPESKAQVEIIREIVMNDEDLEYMEISRQDNN